MKKNCANCAVYDSDTKRCIDDEPHEPDDGCQYFVSDKEFEVKILNPDLTLRQVEDWCCRHNYKLMTEECYDELIKEK